MNPMQQRVIGNLHFPMIVVSTVCVLPKHWSPTGNWTGRYVNGGCHASTVIEVVTLPNVEALSVSIAD